MLSMFRLFIDHFYNFLRESLAHKGTELSYAHLIRFSVARRVLPSDEHCFKTLFTLAQKASPGSYVLTFHLLIFILNILLWDANLLLQILQSCVLSGIAD
jgi:hypothetical protein